MDLSKLRADLEAATTLLAEEQGKVATLATSLTERDATIASLNTAATEAQASYASALAAKDQEIATIKEQHAETRGELKAAKEQVAALQASAKTASTLARETLGQQALSPDALDHLPDGTQRADQPTPKPESAQLRTKTALSEMMAGFFPGSARKA